MIFDPATEYVIEPSLLGRLAVDLNHRGRGLGGYLLFDALRRSYRSSGTTASFAVMVDAKNDLAVGFFMRFGFMLVVGSARRLFLPMQTIARLIV